MSAKTKKYTCWTMQFCGGGAGYGLLEILWRGYTHLSMLIAGGICFWLIIRITKINRGLFTKSVIGGICITSVEFISGCIVNLWLGLSVWDYSGEPMSFYGQICLRFSLLWTALCAIIMPFCRLCLDYGKYASNKKLLKARPPRRREIVRHGTKSLS